MATPVVDWTIASPERSLALKQLQTTLNKTTGGTSGDDIPFADPCTTDHLLLPGWMGRFPLFIATELVNRGLCVYCLLRLFNHRDNNMLYYRQEQLITIDKLFPQDAMGKEYSTPESTIEINSILAQIKTRLTRLANGDSVCSICLNITNASSEFLNFLVDTVEQADYQFSSYHIQRTIPPIFALKQFGLWHYLKHTFGQYVPFFVQNPVPEGNIVDLKECSKLNTTRYTQALNDQRQATNNTPRPQLVPMTHNPNNDPTITAKTPHILPTVESLVESNVCNFFTPKEQVNTSTIYFDQDSPFHIDIFYYTTQPHFTEQLHSLVFNRPLMGEFSLSSGMLKNMSIMGVSNLKPWGLCPPIISPQEQIGLPSPFHHLIPADERDESNEENGWYTKSMNGLKVDKVVPFLPKKLHRYPSVNEWNARTFMINKYCFVQVSCKHNPVFIQGNYSKKSRMLSNSSWYSDLSFYQKARDTIPARGTQEAKEAQSKNNQFTTPLNRENDPLLDLLAAQIQEESSQQQQTGGSNLLGSDAPIQLDPRKKRRNFEHSADDEIRAAEKKQKQQLSQMNRAQRDQYEAELLRKQKESNGNGRTRNHDPSATAGDDDADEIVSINEFDDIFTGVGTGADGGSDDSDNDEDGFTAMLRKRINRERNNIDGDTADAADTNSTEDRTQNNQNNNKKSNSNKIQMDNSIAKTKVTSKDNPNEQGEDDSVGQGALPYAESSVETEIASRILPYFHSVNHTTVGFGVVKYPTIEQALLPTTIEPFETQDQINDRQHKGDRFNSTHQPESITIPSISDLITTPTQLKADHDPTPPANRYGGYCSIHSTNPNGIPCTHYHRTALPGPIDQFYAQNEQDGTSKRPSLVHYNTYRLLFHCRMGFKFHSSGREDLNVRMLGSGRPFLIEITDPHRLPFNLGQIDPNHPEFVGVDFQQVEQISAQRKAAYDDFLSKLNSEINTYSERCSTLSLLPADDAAMDRMTKGIAEKRKVYRCVVHTKDPITKTDLDTKIAALDDVNIIQNTPVRVLFRRAALQRPRHINNIKAVYINPHFFYLDMETQAGTYVKEFVHSDNGRTNPSISSILGTQCDILQLDVIDLIM